MGFRRRRLLTGIFSFVAAILSIPVLLWMFVWMGFFGPLPGEEELKNVQNSLSSEVYASDGRLIGKYFLYDRTAASYEQFPQHLVNALVATEDVRFFEHEGVDYRSLARVAIRTIILQQEESGGGSTITQQLAKNLYGRGNYGLVSLPVNKFREMIIASRLERAYSKQDILELYLNTVSFGDNTYGIETASRRFFNTGVAGLSIEQSAVLIGMLKGTYLYNPRIFPERALSRRNVVLQQMHKYGYLTASELDELKERPVALQLRYTKRIEEEGIAPYFREHLRQELLRWCSENAKPNGKPYNLYTDGLKIHTSINYDMQVMAEKAVKKHLSSLQKTFEAEWGNRAPWQRDSVLIKSAIRRSSAYRSLAEQGLGWSQILDSLKQPRNSRLFDWAGEKQAKSSSIDSLLHHLKFLQAGFIAMEPETGQVLAWVGGIDHEYFKYDHVSKRMKRQAGSTFKPIVYATAIENGLKPCKFFPASKVTYTDLEGWTPSNNDENYEYRFSLKGALVHSVNTVSVKVLEETGIQEVVRFARALNIESEIPEVPSIALGTAELSPTELAGAYASFLNDGRPVEPNYLLKITDRHGKVLAEFEPEKHPVAFSRPTRQAMLEMLQAAVDEGTGSRLRWKYKLTADMAGKTGTTQKNRDGWFVGMLPGLVTVTWVGADDPSVHFKTTSLGQGSASALPVFASFVTQMQENHAFDSYTKARFPEPSASVVRKLDCENMKEETFLNRLFTNEKKEKEREFSEKKKGILGKIKGLLKGN